MTKEKQQSLNVPIDYQMAIQQLSHQIGELTAQNAVLTAALSGMRKMMDEQSQKDEVEKQ